MKSSQVHRAARCVITGGTQLHPESNQSSGPQLLQEQPLGGTPAGAHLPSQCLWKPRQENHKFKPGPDISKMQRKRCWTQLCGGVPAWRTRGPEVPTAGPPECPPGKLSLPLDLVGGEFFCEGAATETEDSPCVQHVRRGLTADPAHQCAREPQSCQNPALLLPSIPLKFTCKDPGPSPQTPPPPASAHTSSSSTQDQTELSTLHHRRQRVALHRQWSPPEGSIRTSGKPWPARPLTSSTLNIG